MRGNNNMAIIWVDGVCNKCGSVVLEMPIVVEELYNEKEDWVNENEYNEALGNDYMNICINPKCKEHYWHYVGDIEFLDYYKHNSGGDNII
jgi:hypothetical protein